MLMLISLRYRFSPLMPSSIFEIMLMSPLPPLSPPPFDDYASRSVC